MPTRSGFRSKPCAGSSGRPGGPVSAVTIGSTRFARWPTSSGRSRSELTRRSGTTYLRDAYPVFDDLTWPGRIPFLALTSGTTQGATKYIPVSTEMVASNRKAAQTALAFYLSSRPESRLFHGRIFFLGGSTDLERARARCFRGRPERDCRRGAVTSSPALHVSSPGSGPGDRLGPQALSTGRAKRRGTDHPGQRGSGLAACAFSAHSRIDRQELAGRGLAAARAGRSRGR